MTAWYWSKVSTEDVLRRLAAWRLPGAPDGPVATSPLEPDEWSRLLEGVNQHRLWGLLGAATAQGDLPVSGDQSLRAEGLHRAAMEAVLELEALAVTTSQALRDAGIETRLLKGLAVAHLDELIPSLRCFNDVDLLVPPTRLPDAVDVLTTMGHRRDLPERRRGFDRRFAKEATMPGPAGREVDLHRTLVTGPFGLTIDLDELWSREQVIQLAGNRCAVLDADRRLVHACFSAVLGCLSSETSACCSPAVRRTPIASSHSPTAGAARMCCRRRSSPQRRRSAATTGP
jgi:hypothetical protein